MSHSNILVQARWFALVNDVIVYLPRQRLKVGVILGESGAPHGHRLFRDHQTAQDSTFDGSAEIDLADGNVFYTRVAAEVDTGGATTKRAKFALAVDDEFELTAQLEQTASAIAALFGLPKETVLYRDFESPADTPFAFDEVVRFVDGPTFITRKGGAKLVKITINNDKYKVPTGETKVATLRDLAKIPDTDELVQIIDRKPHPLPDNGTVCIEGGEEFLSHPRCGSSS